MQIFLQFIRSMQSSNDGKPVMTGNERRQWGEEETKK